MRDLVPILPLKLEALGWMLCHSVWQFTLLWLVFVGADRLARACDARVRYLLACFALALVFVIAIVTTAICWDVAVPELLSRAVTPRFHRSYQYDLLPVRFSGMDSTVRGIDSITSWFAFVWIAILALRCLGVIFAAIRLPILVRRRSKLCQNVTPRWHLLCERLVPDRSVTLRESDATASPFTIGWLRPVIVLPTAVIAGLPAPHIEAVLAHELAHIRRRDYLVNLLQSIAEAVFFYHPCVHLISRRVRQVREECCDDLAVAAIGGAKGNYIDALVAVEEMQPSALQLALGAAGGSLLQRVRRIAQPLVTPRAHRVFGTLGGASLVLGLLFLACSYSAYGYVAEQRLISHSLTMPSSQSVYELLGEGGTNARLPAILEANGPAVTKKIVLTDSLLGDLEAAFDGGVRQDLLLTTAIHGYDPDNLVRPRSDGWRGGSWARIQNLAEAIFNRAKEESDPAVQHRHTRVAVLLAAQASLRPPTASLWIIVADPRFEELSGWSPERVYQLRLLLSAHNAVFTETNLACVKWGETPTMPLPERVRRGVRLYPAVAWHAAHAVRNLRRDSPERLAVIAELERTPHAAGPSLAKQLRSDREWNHWSSTSSSVVPAHGPLP